MMISGQILKESIISGANNIFNNKELVNDLNVFPVPDGDTGSNMARTMSAAKIVLTSEKKELSVAEVMKLTASALLRGARGNSGVILSLIFRGLAKGLEGYQTVDAAKFAKAFSTATEAAYSAVAKPTEGTILTVIRLVSLEAEDIAQNSRDFAGFWNKICKKANEILLKTPEFLPALAESGVVDSGGQGLVFIFEGMNSVFAGNGVIEVKEDEEIGSNIANKVNKKHEVEYGYCTEFLIDKNEQYNEENEKEFKKFLENIGGSIVFVDDDNIIKVHVHSNHPGTVLEKALLYGNLTDIKIDNLKEEVDEHEQKHSAKKNVFEYKPVDESIEYGFVAVAAGDGIENMFKELGVINIVSGGQTMNPSTEEIVGAINATPAKCVFVLPNNKNVVLTAQQAALIADRNVIVLPSRTVPQGVNAILAFNEAASLEENQIEITAAIERVKTGFITTAVRDSRSNNKEIKTGDVLALENGKIKYIEDDVAKACFKLIKNMVKKQSNYITLFYGADVDPQIMPALEKQIKQKFKDLEVNFIFGNQPVYHFIIAVE
ncbi:MAG: DAK2 domain-containing protein [Oscillospiraceae bacterium]|nr:DAK2 domain-containing protein [Oscillospiraceae bacterium]